MLRYMLDTDICIFVLRNRPTEVGETFRRFEHELCISTITVGELFFGVERSARTTLKIDALWKSSSAI